MDSEALGGLFRIRAGVDGLFVLFTVAIVVVIGGILALEGHHLRILRLGDFVGRIRIDEADDHVHETHLTGLHRFVVPQQQVIGARVAAERDLDGLEAFFDTLGNANFAFASQQFHGSHFAHVHAHGIGGAAELGVEIRQRGGGLFDGFFVGSGSGIGQQQGLGIRRFFVDRNAHVVNHVDDVFDLFRIDDFARQVIVDFSVSEVALLLAARDQQFELRLTLVRDLSRGACWRFFDQGGRPMKEGGLMLSRQVYDCGQSVATNAYRVSWEPEGALSLGEASLIRPFRRYSSLIPPLFAVIHPFCGPDHTHQLAFRQPFATL